MLNTKPVSRILKLDYLNLVNYCKTRQQLSV